MNKHHEILSGKKDLLKFLFQLTKNQYKCFIHVFDQREEELRGTCVKDLMTERKTTRSMAQRQLQHFFQQGLVTRESLTLEEFKQRCHKINKNYVLPEGSKGYTYVYHPISYEDLVKLMENRLEMHKKEVTSMIEENSASPSNNEDGNES